MGVATRCDSCISFAGSPASPSLLHCPPKIVKTPSCQKAHSRIIPDSMAHPKAHNPLWAVCVPMRHLKTLHSGYSSSWEDSVVVMGGYHGGGSLLRRSDRG